MSEKTKRKEPAFVRIENIYYIGSVEGDFPDNRTEEEKERDEITEEVDAAWTKLLDDINEKYKDKWIVYACSCCCGGETINIRVSRLAENKGE